MAKSVSVVVTGNTAPLRKELKNATKELSGFAKAQKEFGNVAKIGYAIAGASVVRFGQQLVQAAMEDQKSQALLANSISKTTYASDAATKSAEGFIKQLSLASNIADDDLRPALSTLVRATGDVKRAQDLLTLSTEIATATQKDLGSVSLAVGKAALGNTSALAKLGVPLSENAKSAGNFAVAYQELNAQFGGSNAAALDTAAGRMANLSIRVNELKESLGTLLLPTVEKVTKGLSNAAKASEEKDWLGTLAGGIEAAAAVADAITPDLAGMALSLSDAAQNALGLGKEIKTTGEKTGEGAGSLRLYDEQLTKVKENLDATSNSTISFGDAVNNLIYIQNTTFTQTYADRVKQVADQLAKSKTAAAEAQNKFKELGATLRSALKTALSEATSKLEDAKAAMKSFGDSIAESITGNVTIGDALNTAAGAEENYTKALEDRAAAYTKLNLAQATGDVAGYASALDDVAKAETGVTKAQEKRGTPGQLFADQISKAKKFATDLKTLISAPFNLQQAGLSQLINLGVDAGSAVADELIKGTGSLSVGTINDSLSGLASTAGELGTTAGSLFMGAPVTAAQATVDNLNRSSVGVVNNTYSITITAGVGDEVEIGKQVVKYLQAYDKKFAGIPIKVKK